MLKNVPFVVDRLSAANASSAETSEGIANNGIKATALDVDLKLVETMSNWLEAEEHKKLLRDKEISLRLQREEVVHTHLRQFYDLCHRVNGVRYNSLSIDRLKVECRLSRQTKTEGPGNLHTVDERRGIRISCPNQDETFIDVVVKIHTVDRYWGSNFSDNPEYSSDKEKVVIRKMCTNQELIDWREDQILRAIQWILLESEVIKDSIPGTEIMTEEAVAEAKAKRLQSEKMAAALALERVPHEIAQQQASIADGWKDVGVMVGILAWLMLLYVVCYAVLFYLAVHQNDNPISNSILKSLFSVGAIVFFGAILIGIVVVLVMALIQLLKTTEGKARIADLRSEITFRPASDNRRAPSIESFEKPKRNTGYLLETLRKVIHAREPREFWIGFAMLPVAAVKSIVTFPGRIRRGVNGE